MKAHKAQNYFTENQEKDFEHQDNDSKDKTKKNQFSGDSDVSITSEIEKYNAVKKLIRQWRKTFI